MLQTLAGKLNRLNDVREIGAAIADELRMLIDYHNCRVSVVEGDESSRSRSAATSTQKSEHARRVPALEGRRGDHRPRRGDGESLLLAEAMEYEFAILIPGTHAIEESMSRCRCAPARASSARS